MAESKKTTRGSNFVKNFGRAKPDLDGLLDWCAGSLAELDPRMGHQLSTFFNGQSGVDGKLKFWCCVHKQFPKYNERMWWETKDALDRWRNHPVSEAPLHYPGEGEPAGGADNYFHKDPLTADSNVIPFRIIHTRKITTDMAADAALAFIDQDDYLGELFRWQNTPGQSEWDDKPWDGHLLGLEGSADNCLNAAKEKWFVPTNDKGEQYDPKNGMITVVSESAVRTINWYLNKTGQMRELKVHRIEEIREQFRGPGWQIKPSLKSYRLEWPTIRNLEEASAITKNTLTGLLEGLVEKHLGAEVAAHVYNEIQEGLASAKGDNAPDAEDVWNYFERKWKKYVAAIKPLGNKVPSTIEPNTPELLMSTTRDRMRQISLLQQEVAKQMAYISEVKRANPELFPAGEDPKGGSETQIDQINPADLDNPRLMVMTIDSTLCFPIGSEQSNPEGKTIQLHRYNEPLLEGRPFPKPAIYHHVSGAVGPAATKPVSVDLFVGYELDVDGSKDTYETIADDVNRCCAQSPRLADFGHKVTPEMLKQANQGRSLPEKGKIICPDPRTFGPNRYK